jgi:hypothetical protein
MGNAVGSRGPRPSPGKFGNDSANSQVDSRTIGKPVDAKPTSFPAPPSPMNAVATQMEQLNVKSAISKPKPAAKAKEQSENGKDGIASGVLQVNNGPNSRKEKVIVAKEFSEFEVSDPVELEKVVNPKVAQKAQKKTTEKPQQPKKRPNRKDTTGENTPDSVSSPAPERKAPKQKQNSKTEKVVEVKQLPKEVNQDEIKPSTEEPKKQQRKAPSKQKMAIPTEDFDFELANAKFTKPEDEVDPATTEVYNAQKSFFDDISNDYKDRQNSGEYLKLT